MRTALSLATLTAVALIAVGAHQAFAQEGGAKGFVKPAAPIPTTSYIVDLPSSTYKSKKNKEVTLKAQLLFLNEDTAKKAFANKDELQKIIAKTVETSRADFKTPQGKFALKGEVLNQLTEKGYGAEGVLWNEFMF